MTLVWNKCREACFVQYGDSYDDEFSSSLSYSSVYDDLNDSQYNARDAREFDLFNCQVDCFDEYLIWRCQTLNIPKKGKRYASHLIERLSSTLAGISWHGSQSLNKQEIKCHMFTGKSDLRHSN